MSTDKRVFFGRISVKIGTRCHKLELSPAVLYGGKSGLYRVRIGRRWLDTPEGEPLFFDQARLADLLSGKMFDQVPALPDKAPDIPRGSRVSVNYWHDGLPYVDGVFTSSPPFRGFDGRWYVFVHTYRAGYMAVPTDDVIVHADRRGR